MLFFLKKMGKEAREQRKMRTAESVRQKGVGDKKALKWHKIRMFDANTYF